MPRLSPPAGRSLVEQFCALATVRTGPHFAKFRRACLLETVAALALCLTGTEALAACNLLGETVTCSGFTTGSPVVIAPPPPSVTINILSGATVNGGLDIGVFETVTVNNSGQIVNGPLNIDVTGPGDSVFENNGGISGTVTIDHTLGSTFTFHQSSGQPVGTLNMTGTGDNSLAVNAGTSITNIAMTGGTNYVDNSGTTANQNLVMTATVQNYVVNRPGAQVNTNLLVAPENVVENFGRFNSGITFDDGVGPAIDNANNTVVNYQGATIAGGIHSEADAEDYVENAGVINGIVELGDGDDYFINHNPNVPAISTNGVDLGNGNDQFWMSGGTINNDIIFGDGDDFGIMTGGTLTNRVLGGAGADRFTWSDGIISAGIDMGADDDRVYFASLPAASILGNFLPVDGGTGNDVLTFFATAADGVERFDQWERIDLTSRSQLIFSVSGDTLTLGDANQVLTGTGALSIDRTSSVLAGGGNHTVAPSNSSLEVTVSNGGTIDLTLNPSTDSRFIVLGDYVGLDGALRLEAFLGDDSSPSDQLVIAGADATDTRATRIYVTNLGGPGAQTTGDGIRVVDAQGVATTNPASFVLSAPVGAGVFEYLLFQGGVTDNPASDSDWFLRSQVETTPPPVVPIDPPIPPPVDPPVVPIDPPDPPPVDPPDPPGPGPVEPPDPPTQPPSPPQIPGPEPLPECSVFPFLCPVAPPVPPTIDPDIPLIRPEIPSYVITPGIAQQMGLASLGTFHKRRGDQYLLQGFSHTEAWGRLFGEATERSWDSVISSLDYDLAPRFDGRILGVQAGHDVSGAGNMPTAV